MQQITTALPPVNPQSQIFAEVSVERAIVAAARNSDVCAGTPAETTFRPYVPAVSKQAPPAAFAHQSVPVDLAQKFLTLPATGNQKKVGRPRGLLLIQAAIMAFLTARRMGGRAGVKLEVGTVVDCGKRTQQTRRMKGRLKT